MHKIIKNLIYILVVNIYKKIIFFYKIDYSQSILINVGQKLKN